MNDFLTTMQSFCEKLLQQQEAANIDQSPLQEMSLKEIEDLKQHYLDEMLSLSNDLGIKDYRNEKVDIHFRRECKDTIHDLKGKFNAMSFEISKRREWLILMLFLHNVSTLFTMMMTMITRRVEAEDSLIIRNKEHNTILEKESNEFIKSNVEDLVLILSVRGHRGKDSYDPNLDESTFLVTPLSDSNEDEYFTPGDEVKLLLHCDPSIPKMSVASILEGFIDEPPLEENDDLEPKNDDWKKILYDAPILMTEDKIFDPVIHDQIFSPTYVSLPLTDRHYLFFTYVIQIFLPHFSYPVVSPFLISFGSEDTIFDPGISAFHFSHRSGTFISFNVNPNILNDSLMENFPSTYFTPNITMI
uniref:Reverse transcriptase domain-containing protein n=1 Tax=Tanacetum cinerariifolium TaxID=118510 RepID=A0A699H038_TANCI|nr:hypothetical protein [Tanacetum cinerariifolium]